MKSKNKIKKVINLCNFNEFRNKMHYLHAKIMEGLMIIECLI